jgi:secreted trypsin-like serine protease
LRKSTDPPGVYFCSGSLISSRHVLLAAQCLERCRSFINLSLIWLRY